MNIYRYVILSSFLIASFPALADVPVYPSSSPTGSTPSVVGQLPQAATSTTASSVYPQGTYDPTTGSIILTVPPSVQNNLIVIEQARLNSMQGAQAQLNTSASQLAAIQANPTPAQAAAMQQAGANAMTPAQLTATSNSMQSQINKSATRLNILQSGPLTQQDLMALPQ